MKNLRQLFLIILLVPPLATWASVSFSVKVTNNNNGPVSIGIRHLFNYESRTINSSNGIYTTSYEITEPTADVFIIYGNDNIKTYVKDGDKLSVSFDAKNPAGTLTISGGDTLCRQYEVLFNRNFSTHSWLVEKDSLISHSPDWKSLTATIFDLTKKELAIINSFKGKMPQAIYNKYYADVFYMNFSLLLHNKTVDINPNYADSAIIKFKQFNDNGATALINEAAINTSANYRVFMRDYFYSYAKIELNRLKEMNSFDRMSYPVRLYAMVDMVFDDNEVKEWVKANLISDMLNQLPDFEVEPVFIKYMTNNADSKYKASLASVHFRISGNLEREKAVKNTLIVKDIKGNFINLNDFKGKKVYLEFWASWCGQCVDEMKNYLPKIRAQLKDKNIVIISLSIDENSDAWKNALKRLNPTDIELIGDKSTSLIKEYYNVYSLPKYLVIDETGKLINNSAPRPSELVNNPILFNDTFVN